jgi:GT2 family glycosyltransferase
MDKLPISLCLATKRGVKLDNKILDKLEEVNISRKSPLSLARAELVKKSTQPYILFVDDDVHYTYQTIKNLFDEFLILRSKDKNIVGLSAIIKPYQTNTYWEKAEALHMDIIRNQERGEEVRAIGCVFSMFDREVLIKHNFDTKIEYGVEDMDLCFRLRNAGYRLYLSRNVKIFHENRCDLVGFCKQRIWYIKGNLTTLTKYDKRYYLLPFLLFPYNMYRTKSIYLIPFYVAMHFCAIVAVIELAIKKVFGKR